MEGVDTGGGAARDVLQQMVRSRGWVWVLERFLVPYVQTVTRALENPATPQERTVFVRGQKHMLNQLMNFVYSGAQMESPFEQYDKALLMAIVRGKQEEDEAAGLSTASVDTQERLLERVRGGRRTSYPV